VRRCTHCGGEHLAEHWERCLDCGAALPSAPSKPLLANPVVGGMGPDFWELNLPQGGMLVIGPEGVDFFRDRESYDRDVGYHPDDSLMFANISIREIEEQANAGAVPRRNDVGTSPLLGGS